jgi:hypothetical protein
MESASTMSGCSSPGFRTSAASGTRNFVGWWTYAGGTIHSTLRHAIAAIEPDWKITADDVPVRLRGEEVNSRYFRDAPGKLGSAGFRENTELWQDIGRSLPGYRLSKFQPLMPARVERETLERYLLDLEGTRDWLARTASSRDGKAPTRGFGAAPRQFRIVVTATADHYLFANRFGHRLGTQQKAGAGPASKFLNSLERETRFELATPTLARLCSTTELFPL